MNDQELLNYSLANVRDQVTAVFDGLGEENRDVRIHEQAMTPGECLGHLCECCQAFLTIAGGGEHAWGTFTPAGTTLSELMTEWTSMRDNCDAVIKFSEDGKRSSIAMDYLILHEAYHVGQMVTVRLSIGNWDAYSIYQGH